MEFSDTRSDRTVALINRSTRVVLLSTAAWFIGAVVMLVVGLTTMGLALALMTVAGIVATVMLRRNGRNLARDLSRLG